MADLRSIYQELTSVSIDDQFKIWDERGKGYYGEFLVFQELYPNIIGQSKILMNLNLPTPNGKGTEIDLLLIHESGLYVFEVKHYKGTIYGKKDDEIWTQYFRTHKNSHFHNPIKQNEYHVAAIKSLFPDLPVYSFIVFTNRETKIKITELEKSNTAVCTINELPSYINKINDSKMAVFNADQINNIFNQLSEYAPMGQEIVFTDAEPISFINYINKIKDEFQKSVDEIKKSEQKKYKLKVTSVFTAAGIICAAIIVISLSIVLFYTIQADNAKRAQATAEAKFSLFSQKFQQVNNLGGENIELEDNFIEVTDYKLKESKDFKNRIVFSCKIKVNGEKYGIGFHPNSKIIVKLKNGMVYEYKTDNVGNSYKRIASFDHLWYADTTDLPEIMINTSSVDDIAFIKLTDVIVWSRENQQANAVPNAEFELYSSN